MGIVKIIAQVTGIDRRHADRLLEAIAVTWTTTVGANPPTLNYSCISYMPQPTIQDFFGANATQTATDITIKKADLPFTATANNNGEQVVAALLKKMQGNATQTAFMADGDRNIFVEPGYIGTQYRTIGTEQQTLIDTPLSVHFARVAENAGIDPDSY